MSLDKELGDISANKKILDIPLKKLNSLDSDELLLRIIKHYHRQRPKSLQIEEITFNNEDYYTLEQLAESSDPKIRRLVSEESISDEEVLIESIGKADRVSGYEIIRYYYRPPWSRAMPKKQFCETFYVSQSIVERLVELDLVRVTWKDKGVIAQGEAHNFYNLIFPMKGAQEYQYLRLILRKHVRRKHSHKRGVILKRLPEPITEQEILSMQMFTDQDARDEKEYILARVIKFKPNEDYQFDSDSRTQRLNANYVRGRKQGVIGRVMELNLRDVKRLYLAKASVPEPQFFDKVYRTSTRRKIRFDRESILDRLRQIMLAPILYDDFTRMQHGSLEIVLMNEDRFQRIAALAKPLIAKYGHFVSESDIRNILRMDVSQLNSLGNRLKSIPYFTFVNTKMYNLFLLVDVYESEIKARYTHA